MNAQYLSYWIPETADRELRAKNTILDHSASEQYKRLKKGEVVWIVTVREPGRLALLGRLLIGTVTDQEGAELILGRSDLWDASHHIIAEADSAEKLREVDVSDLAEKIRFKSSRDRLSVPDGRVNPGQLQSMRRLTPPSAGLFERRWAGG